MDLGGRGYRCWNEVSFLGNWIDLYARDAGGHCIAIELKVTDWSRALKQAIRVRNSAHETYVGIWAPYVHRCLTPLALARFTASGVGLLAVNGESVVKLPASPREPRYKEHAVLPPTPLRA